MTPVLNPRIRCAFFPCDLSHVRKFGNEVVCTTFQHCAKFFVLPVNELGVFG